jgi:hypothetical protein
MLVRIYDLLSLQGNSNAIGSGKDYNITNLAALPADFTTDFTSASLAAGVEQTFFAKEFPNNAKIGIQILVTAKGAGFSKATLQLQQSNVGGTADGVWSDVGTATDVSDVGSGFYTMPTDPYRRAKFYRVQLLAAGGTATVYVIGFGYAES